MADPVQIAHFRLSRSNGSSPCSHLNLTIEGRGRIVRCDDCRSQVDPIWALAKYGDAHRTALHAVVERCEDLQRDRDALQREREEFEAQKRQCARAHVPALRRAIAIAGGVAPAAYDSVAPPPGSCVMDPGQIAAWVVARDAAIIDRCARAVEAVQPSSVSTTGEVHMRSYRDAIAHAVRKVVP